MKRLICILFLIFYVVNCSLDDEFCDADRKNDLCNSKNEALFNARYIFYDVNPPEGFNLRRDVYMRMANFARKIKNQNWLLVLPPWPHLYHWFSDLPEQSRLPWRLFFNISMLSSFTPVVEMSEFFETRHKAIDQVYVLQHYEDMFTTGNFDDRMSEEPCHNHIMYEKTPNGYLGHFWGYGNLTAKKVTCLSFHGPASQLVDIIKKTDAKTIMFDHAEIALHDNFGDKTYWDARKSMKFADHLIQEGAKFRRVKLNSTDESDGTRWPNERRVAIGGDYICVHLRRRDFTNGRSKEVPSIKSAAAQIEKSLKDLNLQTVFVATDAPEKEKDELKSYLQNYTVLTYNPTKEAKLRYKDGGIAIIEQIICSHARRFIGTHESTFSFRIQEEREIMGFKPETTFNRLCGDKEPKCKPPSKWLIVY